MASVEGCLRKAQEAHFNMYRLGKLLSQKQEEFVEKGQREQGVGFKAWLKEKCPVVSKTTAYECIFIYREIQKLLVLREGLTDSAPETTTFLAAYESLSLPETTSFLAIYNFFKKAEAEQKQTQEKPVLQEPTPEDLALKEKKEDEKATQKLKNVLHRFWATVISRPVDRWKQGEQREYVTDLRLRAKLVKDAGIKADGFKVRKDGVIEIDIQIEEEKIS